MQLAGFVLERMSLLGPLEKLVVCQKPLEEVNLCDTDLTLTSREAQKVDYPICIQISIKVLLVMGMFSTLTLMGVINMSVYLIYFEKKQQPTDGDFSGFDNVNNYTLPDILHGEETTVDYLGKEIKANIIFDGVSSGDFYFFGKNREGKKGELCRNSLKEFILSRMKNKCVNPFIYLDIFNGEMVYYIKLPEFYVEHSLAELDSIFKSSTYKGFFNIV
ncbi:hypothetical protein REV77_000015 [Klebsiella aerogenes]|nr:hypothetical protein [Klebsiella aerogenes]